MEIQPTSNINFGVLTHTKTSKYAYKCYIDKFYGTYKGHDLFVQRNYINNKLCSTLISIKKAGEWVKSKLKYFDNGRQTKILRSKAK